MRYRAGLDFGIDLRCCIESKSLQLLCLDSGRWYNKLFPVRKGVSASAQTPDHSQSVAGSSNCANKGSLRERTSVIICLFNVLVLRQGCTL